MSNEPTETDAEFEAIQKVYSALQALGEDARARVLDYVSNRLGLSVRTRPAKADQKADPLENQEEIDAEGELGNAREFGSFAELCDAARPKSQSDKALLGGYWLQVCQGAETFDGFAINKELKNLGEGILNITSALDTLKAQKPALALQLKKSGKSRQARKTFKVSVAGIKAAEAMIGG